MTGFLADWLALREGPDHRARNGDVRDAVVAYLADRKRPNIVDLACGAGSNLKALAPYLSAHQHWRLIDHDQQLLEAARRVLAAWANIPAPATPLKLMKDGRRIDVSLEARDISKIDDAFFDKPIDLVTSSAFFDLVSEDWIYAFCEMLARRSLPLYAVLTYTGGERWSPPHQADAQMLAAFHAHQSRDKGFGPSAGPRATELLAAALRARGYRVSTGVSCWRLDQSDARLIQELADGSARAIGETDRLPAEIVENWRLSRRVATICEVEHADLFAIPLAM